MTSDYAYSYELDVIDAVHAAAEFAPSYYYGVAEAELAFVYLVVSDSSYSISQIVIYGSLKALSPAARYFPSEENLAHWKGRDVREAKNLICFASRGEYITKREPAR